MWKGVSDRGLSGSFSPEEECGGKTPCVTGPPTRMLRLNCIAQNYDWGKLGSSSAVAKLKVRSSL